MFGVAEIWTRDELFAESATDGYQNVSAGAHFVCDPMMYWLRHITVAVTGPPPKHYEFKSGVIGGSGSPLCSPRLC